MKKISLIIPCYNEAPALPLFAKELNKVITQMNKETHDYSFEVLLIDDGSTDETKDVMKDLCHRSNLCENPSDARPSATDKTTSNKTAVSDASFPENIAYKYISFSRNFGKEAAMYAGFSNASGDYVAVMDADLQDPPTLLPEMIHILETEDYESVATRRVTRKGEPPIRSFFARQFYKLINKISDANVVDGARDFRLMKREMVDAILAMSEYNRFSKGIFGWIGFKTKWIEFENVNRIAGETKWSFFGLFKYAVNGIINFSETPMSVASSFGIFCTILSFAMLLFFFIRKLIFGDPVAGWPSLVCIILFIAGLQFLCMGIMGKYIAKTYTEVKERPHYIVSDSDIEDIKKIK